MLLGLLCTVTVFYYLHGFKDIVICPFIGIYLAFFLMIILGLCILGRKTTVVKCNFYHIISRVYILSTWYVIVNVNVVGLLVFQCLHYKVIYFPLFLLYSLEGSHYVLPTFKEWGVIPLWRGDIFLYDLESLYVGDLFIFSHLLIYDYLLISVWALGFFNFIFWVMVKYYCTSLLQFDSALPIGSPYSQLLHLFATSLFVMCFCMCAFP